MKLTSETISRLSSSYRSIQTHLNKKLRILKMRNHQKSSRPKMIYYSKNWKTKIRLQSNYRLKTNICRQIWIRRIDKLKKREQIKRHRSISCSVRIINSKKTMKKSNNNSKKYKFNCFKNKMKLLGDNHLIFHPIPLETSIHRVISRWITVLKRLSL